MTMSSKPSHLGIQEPSAPPLPMMSGGTGGLGDINIRAPMSWYWHHVARNPLLMSLLPIAEADRTFFLDALVSLLEAAI